MADPQRNGVRTSEFWLTVLAMVLGLGLFIAESLAAEGSLVVKALAMAVQGLAAMGYAFGRSKLKVANVLALAANAAKEPTPPKT